jgi:hypothetical protein
MGKDVRAMTGLPLLVGKFGKTGKRKNGPLARHPNVLRSAVTGKVAADAPPLWSRFRQRDKGKDFRSSSYSLGVVFKKTVVPVDFHVCKSMDEMETQS